MLPKSERLHKEDFIGIRPKVFFRGEYFDVSLLPSKTTKFACVISKKKIKRAVDRNKVKRIIFNCVRESPLKAVLEGKDIQYHIIFYPKPTAQGIKYPVIEEEISKVFATLQ